MINALVCWLEKVKLSEISPERNKAELCPGCWLAILLSLFFIVWRQMNETQTIATKETRKRTAKEHQKSSSVPIYLPLQLSAATALPMFCTNLHRAPSSHLYLNPFLPSSSLHSFFLDPAVLSPLLYLHTLLLASPYTGSHLCTSDTLINPGFVLLQKGVGCPSGSTLIAVWEQTRIVKYLPLFSSLVILYSLSHPPALHH